jgi:hypothetical protein
MLDGSNNGTFDNPPNAFWSDTLLPETTSFIYELIKPKTQKISSDTVICENHESIQLKVSDNPQSTYVWLNIDSIDVLSPYTNQASIDLHFPDTGFYQIGVVEFNEILCAGDTIWFNIQVTPNPDADFYYFVNNDTIFLYSLSDSVITHNWFIDNNFVSNEVNPVIVLEDGFHEITLQVEDSFKCYAEVSDTVEINLLSSSLTIPYSEAHIFPNPVSDMLFIETPWDNVRIFISDISGKTVMQQPYNGNQIIIQTTSLPKGIYFIQIIGNEEQKIIRKKIVKI